MNGTGHLLQDDTAVEKRLTKFLDGERTKWNRSKRAGLNGRMPRQRSIRYAAKGRALPITGKCQFATFVTGGNVPEPAIGVLPRKQTVRRAGCMLPLYMRSIAFRENLILCKCNERTGYIQSVSVFQRYSGRRIKRQASELGHKIVSP